MAERTHYKAEILLGAGGCMLLEDQHRAQESRLGPQLRQGVEEGRAHLHGLLQWTTTDGGPVYHH